MDIIIPTRNRIESLRLCLDALRQQTHHDFGVIIVDDGSDRPIVELLGASDRRDLDITIIRNDRPLGPAAGRNVGVRASNADFVIFLDDDLRPASGLVEQHLFAVTAVHDPSRPLVSFGPMLEPRHWDSTAWTKWETSQSTKEAKRLREGVIASAWRWCHTGNNCVPRAVFSGVGGFNEAFKRAEDDELSLRLHKHGCDFVYVPDAVAYHHPKRSLQSWLELPRLYTYFELVIDRLYPDVGYSAAKRSELARRKWPIRTVRALVRSGKHRTQWVVGGSVAVARLAHRFGLTRLTVGALSITWDSLVLRTYQTTVLTETDLEEFRTGLRSTRDDEVEAHDRA